MTAACTAQGLTLYVSGDPGKGNDNWSGRLAEAKADGTDGPFATLGRAQAELRKLKAAGRLDGPATVFVRRGVYELTETFSLGPEDSGTPENPVVYHAYPNEKPVLTGAYRITGFKPYKGNILQCDLKGTPLEKTAFRQLFFRGKRQIMARYPNLDPKDPHGGTWAHILDVEGEGVRDRFIYTEDVGRGKQWTNVQQAKVCVHPSYGWGWNIVPIKSVNPEESEIVLARNTSYDLRVGDRYYVQNLLEELDAPGEWYLDRDASTLYFWPPSDLADGEVRAPMVDTIIAIKDAGNITVRGFTIEACDGDAVRIENGERCMVAQSVIRNCGGWGVRVTGGHKSGAMGNDIYATGAGGVFLAGGDRKTLERGDNFAANNYIHHIAAFRKTYNTGVNVSGVGNTASHNLIHDTYHAGMTMGGNDNTIEYNIIHHTNLGAEDTGGLYMSSRDWSQRGCVIRYNILHHCGGFGKIDSWRPVHNGKVEFQYPRFSWAIYLDCPTTGNLIYGNVIWSAPIWGLFNASGRDNTWENNIIVGSPAYQAYTMKDGWKCWPDMFKKLKAAQKPGSPYLKRYPELAEYNEVRPGAMRNVKVLRNIFYYTEDDGRWLREKNKKAWGGGQLLYSYASHVDDFDKNEFDYNTVYAPPGIGLRIRFRCDPDPWQNLTWTEWQKLGTDTHSVMADPMFVDPARHDYRLQPESPALKLGFKPIPFEKIGPYQDELRASWPIVEAPGAAALGEFTTVRYFKLPGYEPVPAREFSPRGGAGNFFAKLAAKQPVKVVVFAGGGHAQGGWRKGVAEWLRDRYPGIDITDIDASICGCVRGSAFSVYRFAHDALSKKPDLVFVDFAVDDFKTDYAGIWRPIEGIVRQAWRADPNLDLVFVYGFKPGFEEDYAKNLSPSAVSAYEKLAEHYGIPSINMGCRIAQMAKEGKLVFKASAEEAKQLTGKVVFSKDGVYTSAAGNEVYAQIITEALEKLAKDAVAGPHELKKPFCRQNLERATLAAITPNMLEGKWEKMSPDNIGGKSFAKHFDEIWFTNTPGSKLTFTFRGADAGLFDLMGPDTGRIRVTVDGKDAGCRQQVDRWAYYQRLAAVNLAHRLEDKEHTVTVELLPDPPDRRIPIEEAKKNNKYKPDDFKGVALRIGWIRIVGQLVNGG